MEIPAPAVARFDTFLNAWVLTRYADVLAALRDPRLSAAGARGGGEPERSEHLRFRTEAAAAAETMSHRLAALKPLASGMCKALPGDRPVDLVSEFAKPWSTEAAMRVVCADGQSERLTGLAAEILAAAADPFALDLSARAELATQELAAAFSGPLTAFRIQAFVALSQTLPAFLANAWLALLRNSQEAEMLRDEPARMPEAIEELLRYAGPSRAQFRRAAEPVDLGGAAIASGDRVVLMLAAANRDPEQFPEPGKLNLRRGATRHLAFGAGGHACLGAALVREAAAIITAAFVDRYAGAPVREPVAWRGGFAICAPAEVVV